MASFSRIKTWVAREVLKAADLNAEFDNIINNFTPTGLDDVSANIAGMQISTDPGGVGSESLATTTAGEIYRLRFMLQFLLGKSQWYDHTGRSLAIGQAAIKNADLTDNDINGGKIVDATLATAKYIDGSITRPKMEPVGAVLSASCGSFLTSSSTSVNVTNLSLSITTTGRPVVLELVWDQVGGVGNIGVFGTGNTGGVLECYRGATLISTNSYTMPANSGGTMAVGLGSFNFTDYAAPAAVNTYTVKARGIGGPGTIVVSQAKLAAREL